ncbi:MAG TPA: HNH endonuclease signature motif containing protein [Egibacteraceae bacterium]|nr:HNH endonuclease signature motif containing protein [Egibacteraceae bacterium]
MGRRGEFSHSSPAWRAVRLAALERDGYLCQIRGPHCRVKATEGDHIVPLALGGAWFDLDNVRASCKPCNAGRMMREAVGGGQAAVRRPSREW